MLYGRPFAVFYRSHVSRVSRLVDGTSVDGLGREMATYRFSIASVTASEVSVDIAIACPKTIISYPSDFVPHPQHMYVPYKKAAA